MKSLSIRAHFAARLLRAASTLCLLGLAAHAAQDSAERLTAAIHADPLGLARWRVVAGDGPTFDVVREPLLDTGTALRSGPAVVWIDDAPSSAPSVHGVAIAPGGGADSVRIVVAVHGGGDRYLSVWDVSSSLNGERRTLGSARVKSVQLGSQSDPAAPAAEVARDLAHPALLRRNGAHWLFADAWRSSTAGLIHTRAVVIARLAPELDSVATPNGRVIANGIDPRIVDLGDEVLLALRSPANAPQSWGDAPVRFYRSKDLVTWTEDRELGAGVSAKPAYSLAADADGVWLATWSGEGANARLNVQSRRGGGAAWQLVSETSNVRVRAGAGRGAIEFLSGPRGSEGRPRIAYPGLIEPIEVR